MLRSLRTIVLRRAAFAVTGPRRASKNFGLFRLKRVYPATDGELLSRDPDISSPGLTARVSIGRLRGALEFPAPGIFRDRTVCSRPEKGGRKLPTRSFSGRPGSIMKNRASESTDFAFYGVVRRSKLRGDGSGEFFLGGRGTCKNYQFSWNLY